MDLPAEDDDITLLRQSKKIPEELGQSFEHIEDVKNERELDAIIRKIEPYQEDPQLLDASLGHLIPLLSTKFLTNLQHGEVLQTLSKILYTLTKVRGEKVIISLLNNEPRYIEPLLEVITTNTEPLPWEQSYVLLLWLSHLMLSPFDLTSISSFEDDGKIEDGVIVLPEGTPSIATQVVRSGIMHLRQSTIERKAASSLLVRLCIRQDMLNLGLLGVVTAWAIAECSSAARESQIHACLGTLTLLSGLVASADQKMLGLHLAPIFRLSQRVLDDESLSSIKSSAIARKLVIKILRNTVVHCLQAEQSDLATTEVVEEVIGALIELLADSDTPVRMAASKALGIVALKLDKEMAAEVVDAINGSFHEELVGDDKSFFSVNGNKWHGIALTFGHLLHKRAVATEQIPDVLKSILYALSFEQRSTAGKSVGAHVRDAANYGLWAVARRCTTEELLAIPTSSFTIHDAHETTGSIQYIALNLITSACFDPDGNVRRGSSAALQELIGRHPNTIIEGISLVQVVDYQSVGLRARACTRVARAAAGLNELYQRTLIEAMLTWRGLASASQTNRQDSAVFAGLLLVPQTTIDDAGDAHVQEPEDVGSIARDLLQRIRDRLCKLKARDQEERQGLILAASWVITAIRQRFSQTSNGLQVLSPEHSELIFSKESLSAPEFDFILSDEFKPRAARSELVISAALRHFGQLAGFFGQANAHPDWEAKKHFALLAKCVSRSDEIVLEQVPQAIALSMNMLSDSEANELVRLWLSDLAPENKKIGVRESAKVLALGAAFGSLPRTVWTVGTHVKILSFLLERYVHVDTDNKIIILQSLKLILCGLSALEHIPDELTAKFLGIIATILLLALHDYTISERGDVGSLVRLAGLAALQEAWSHEILITAEGTLNDGKPSEHASSLRLDVYDVNISQAEHLRASVLRLSLEKLDKVRLAAVDCWQCRSSTKQVPTVGLDTDIIYLLTHGAPLPPKVASLHDVSSTLYFYHFLTILTEDSVAKHIKLRIMEGFCTTAGGAGLGASQNLLNTREALHLFLTTPPDSSHNKAVFASILKDGLDLNTKLENDQRLVSLLEVAAFTAELGLLPFSSQPPSPPPPSSSPTPSSSSFLTTLQRSHFKSRNIRKLQVCLDVYRGLVYIPAIRTDVLKLITGMLLHPIPAVRITAAETLVAICGDGEVAEKLGKMDWTRAVKESKEIVAGIKQSIEAGLFVVCDS